MKDCRMCGRAFEPEAFPPEELDPEHGYCPYCHRAAVAEEVAAQQGQKPCRTSADWIAKLDDPAIAAAVNEKGGGRLS